MIFKVFNNLTRQLIIINFVLFFLRVKLSIWLLVKVRFLIREHVSVNVFKKCLSLMTALLFFRNFITHKYIQKTQYKISLNGFPRC